MENLIIQNVVMNEQNLYLLFQSQLAKEMMYRKGATIFMQGMPAQYLYFIQSGKVKTYVENAKAQILITSIFKPGDFFGHTSLFSETKYQESTETLEDSYLVKIPKAIFFSLLRNNPKMLKLFINTLADDIHKKNKQLLSLAYDTDSFRVGELLMHLAKENNVNHGNEAQINIPKMELANLLGLNSLIINKVLIIFKSKGYIDIKGNSITILNMQHFKSYYQNLE
jgi:CRP-like cAMP-binding protein